MTVVASNFERKKNELYETEEWATEALLRHLDIRGSTVWEPAAGGHKMADVLKAHAAEVITSDIETYGREHDFIYDFFDALLEAGHPANINAIITNPPYGKGNRLAAEFARLALSRSSGTVALLLTAKFDSGKSRADLFRDNPRFFGKVVLVDRIQWFEGASTGTEDHAWFIWGPGAYDQGRLFYEGRGAA